MSLLRYVSPLGSFRHHAAAIFIFAALLAACSSATVQPVTTPTETGIAFLTPYHTSTPAVSLSPALSQPTKTLLPPPTGTPFTHTIKKDETLLGIAFKYGVKLEDLLATNPGVNVHFLTIGTVLVIPLNGDLATPAPTIAPPLLPISEPGCYLASDANLLCLAEITNPLVDAYEKMTLKFDLYAQDGTLISEQFIVPILDRLLPGSALPVLASFSIPLPGGAPPEEYSVRLTLLSALAITPGVEQAASGSRYLEPAIHDLQVQISEDANSAQVSGMVAVPEGTSSFGLVAVAYDQEQRPVGLRWIEKKDICSGQAGVTPEPVDLTAAPPVCAELPFELSVYSLGPAIERVAVFAEAHR